MDEDGDEDSAASMENSEAEEVSEAAQVDKAKAFAVMLKKSGTYLPAYRAIFIRGRATCGLELFHESRGVA